MGAGAHLAGRHVALDCGVCQRGDAGRRRHCCVCGRLCALGRGAGRRPGAARREGAYFGWWNFATKLNLALAAGVALPLLGALGYSPGTRDPEALRTLALAYAVLPCALKLLAASTLAFFFVRRSPRAPVTV